MKVRVLDPWNEYVNQDLYNPHYGWHTHSTTSNAENWQEMDITMDELKDLIERGYKIKINC